MAFRIEDFRFSSSSVDDFFHEKKFRAAAAASPAPPPAPVRMRVASLHQLAGFSLVA